MSSAINDPTRVRQGARVRTREGHWWVFVGFRWWPVSPQEWKSETTTPVPAQRVDEPTGQHAIVMDADRVPYLRLGHRWYKAGDSTAEPTPWPAVGAVEVLSKGEPS